MCYTKICIEAHNWSAQYLCYKLKKGAQIKSYLISHAKIRAGFKMWKQIDLYFHHKYSLGSHILYCKCVNLYLVKLNLYLITILSPGQSTIRCVKTASTRCVFKILNFSRLFIPHCLEGWWWISLMPLLVMALYLGVVLFY